MDTQVFEGVGKAEVTYYQKRFECRDEK